MISFGRQVIILSFCFMLVVLLFGCQKPKEGKVIISDQNFSMRQDNKYNWVIDAKGKVKNVGEADVKNVVVTGDCLSCRDVIQGNEWFISGADKTSQQKDIVAYLPVGAEQEFKFTEVAFLMTSVGKAPDKMPEKMECKILSFETVHK